MTLGRLQVSDGSRYERTGFVVEMFSFWNGNAPTWAVPDWEEYGAAELAGPFASREEAQTAIENHDSGQEYADGRDFTPPYEP